MESVLLLSLAMVVAASTPSVGEVDANRVTNADSIGDCFDCVLGLYDDEQMTSNLGIMYPGVVKHVFLGIRFGGGYGDLTGIEFSIAGMRIDEDGIILLDYEGLTPISNISGYVPQAPADTSRSSTGEGGILFLWYPAVQGSQALVRLSLLSYAPLTDHILQVKRMYPPSSPLWKTPVLIQLRGITSIVTRISGDCYILNWSGDPAIGCDPTTMVEKSTWSSVRSLFR